jgi:Lon protease-like protein
MFPLGTVLFPGLALPLHVFEPRYQSLVQACLDGDGHFGIVLIERGSEVGGGDVRFAVGTRARIAEAVVLDDGRWLLVLIGVDRIRVRRWLPEQPYPRAEVDHLGDEPAGPDGDELRNTLEHLVRTALALQAELGEGPEPATAEVSLDPDPGRAAWQAAALAPFGPADAQRVLEADGIMPRLRLLVDLLSDEVDVLALRAAGR